MGRRHRLVVAVAVEEVGRLVVGRAGWGCSLGRVGVVVERRTDLAVVVGGCREVAWVVVAAWAVVVVGIVASEGAVGVAGRVVG